MTLDEIIRWYGYAAFRSVNTPELLQAWCDDYLDPDQWKKLKNSIWASRKRGRGYKIRKKKQVDLDLYTWQRLKERAEEHNLNLSDMILKMDEIMDRAEDLAIK